MLSWTLSYEPTSSFEEKKCVEIASEIVSKIFELRPEFIKELQYWPATDNDSFFTNYDLYGTPDFKTINTIDGFAYLIRTNMTFDELESEGDIDTTSTMSLNGSNIHVKKKNLVFLSDPDLTNHSFAEFNQNELFSVLVTVSSTPHNAKNMPLKIMVNVPINYTYSEIIPRNHMSLSEVANGEAPFLGNHVLLTIKNLLTEAQNKLNTSASEGFSGRSVTSRGIEPRFTP